MKHRLISLVAATTLALFIVATSAVNADGGPASPLRECTHPTVGFPTCYVRQDDGMWAREELADSDSTWLTVGRVTNDAVAAAIGDVNAIAP